MSPAVLIEGLLLVGMSLVGLFEGTRLTKIDLVAREPVGPGWYVIFLSAILLVTGLSHLWTHRGRGAPNTGSRPAFKLGAAAIALALFVAYAALAPVVGFVIATVAFLLATLRTFGERSWIRSVAVALVLTVALAYGFGNLAQVALP